MDKHLDQIAASRPAFVQPYNGVASAEDARKVRPANIGIRTSDDGETEIVEIFDEIGGWGVWASELIPHLRRIDGAGKRVEFRLNSPGGDVFEGIAISNAIRFMKAKTTSVVYGLAASAASVIAVSADELLMPSNSWLMIHRPWMLTWGEAQDLRDGADLLDKIEITLVDTYAAKAKDAKRDDLAQMVADETWLTAQESVAIGLADRILDDIKMAASAARDVKARRDAPAEALALLAGLASTEQEATVSDATPTEEAPVAEAVAEVTDEALADDETPEAELEAAPVTTDPEPAASIDEISADLTPEPPAADAEDGSPIQTTPEPEAPVLNEEAIAIRAACAVLDASEKADGFISAGMTFEEVRKRLWDHRVASAAQTEIDTQGTSLLAENPADQANQPKPSNGPSDLKRSRAARAGRTI